MAVSEQAARRQRVLLFGATGTIGGATLLELRRRGYDVVCFVRNAAPLADLPGQLVQVGDVTDPGQLRDDGLMAQGFDAVISCMSSRTGAPDDTWAIDHRAHRNILEAMLAAGIPKMVLLSAICVQKPRLAFQHAKLAFERELAQSGVTYSIVRPTAYFKSLSGQIERLKEGKPFLVLGDGRQTACKPISDNDLACYLVDCLEDGARDNQILPVGGPGPAITPREQGEKLFELLGKPPKFRQVPAAVFGVVVAALGAAARVLPSLGDKAELARIGQYYATESMLVWNSASARYEASATPEFGEDRLFDFYRDVIEGSRSVDRGDHAVF
jgi:divinyl chlorophyllide a 8-vinyl-reductase